MGKKTRAKTQSKKKPKTSKSQICNRKRQAILRKLQQIATSRRNTNDTSYAQGFSLPEGDTTFTQDNANGHHEGTTYNNKCYRCRHFLQIPQNLSQPFCKRISGSIARCEIELSFVQALVWLKSAAACVSQISVEQLRRIFNRQWRTDCDETGDTHTDDVRCVEQSEFLADKGLFTCDEDVMKSAVATSSISPNISYVTYAITPESIDKLRATLGDVQDSISSHMLTNNGNELLIDESSMQERCSDLIVESKRRRISPAKSPTVSRTTLQHLPSSSPETFGTPDLFDSPTECENVCLESGEAARCLTQPASRNYTEQTNKEIMKYTVVTRNGSTLLPSPLDNRNVFPTPERCTVVRNEQRKHILSTINQSTDYESNLQSLLNFNLGDGCLTPIASQSKSHNEFQLTSNCNLKDLIITHIDISQSSSDAATWKRQGDSNSCDRVFSKTFNDNESQFNLQLDNPDGSDTRINTAAIKSPKYDSAYSTSNIDIRNSDVGVTSESTTREASKRVSDGNTRHRYELRSHRKRTITHEAKTTNSPSILRGVKKLYERRPIAGESEFECTGSRSGSKEETISAAWLSFTLESLNVDHVILESSKVILSTLCDKSIAEEYAKRRYWKGTLEEEALNALLNVSDIFRIERKPNICRKEIVMTIIKTLDEITKCVQLNKTSIWMYRIEIILELCNSLSICVEIIDHLIAKLKLFPSILIDTVNIQRNAHNRSRLIFYALNITLEKYRMVIPNDIKSRSVEAAIPHVADLWYTRYIDEELEGAGLNLDAVEKRWIEVLEDFAIISTKHYVQFADKSLSLLRVLISQYHEYKVHT